MPTPANPQFPMPSDPPKPPVFGKSGYIGPKAKPTPKPTPLTSDQQKSAELDARWTLGKKYYRPPADGGWTAKGVHELDTKIGTLNGLMDKVGPKSPRYSEFLGAKARYQAGAEKLMTPVAEPPKGIHPSTNKHWYAWQQGPGESTADLYAAQTKTSPQMAEDYDIKTNTYTSSKKARTKAAADYNADTLNGRKNTLNAGNNASYYANKKKK